MPERVLADKQLSPELNALTHRVIGACIAVHKALGPGLLESVYEACVCRELSLNDMQFQRQVALPLEYRGLRLESGYVMDLVVDNKVNRRAEGGRHAEPNPRGPAVDVPEADTAYPQGSSSTSM